MKEINVVEEESVLWRVVEWFMLYVKKRKKNSVSVVTEMEVDDAIIYK